jgi:hypothetical protein
MGKSFIFASWVAAVFIAVNVHLHQWAWVAYWAAMLIVVVADGVVGAVKSPVIEPTRIEASAKQNRSPGA